MLDSLHFQFGSALKPEKSSFSKFMSKIQKLIFKLKGFDPNQFVAAVFKPEIE